MKTKIFFVIFAGIAGFLIWQGYPIVKSRYFSADSEKKPSTIQLSEQDNPNMPEDAGGSEETTQDTDETLNQTQENLKQDGKIFQKITRENCDAECSGFFGDDLEYCQEICGLKPVQTNSDTCDNLSGIKKDYCLKDFGISKKDIAICEKINDSNVKLACKNRVLEDSVDEFMENKGELPS